MFGAEASIKRGALHRGERRAPSVCCRWTRAARNLGRYAKEAELGSIGGGRPVVDSEQPVAGQIDPVSTAASCFSGRDTAGNWAAT